jgi:FKBP-type peptidyl-prolyl cis-trans isomerase 2
MTFKDGDFLEVEYSVWDATDNSLVATTDEKKAKEGNIYNEKARYGPSLMVLGAPGIVKGLDKELRAMNESDTRKFTLKPAEAFGDRSEDLIRVMPLSDFKARDMNPYPGMRVTLDDVTATVKSVNSGRVVVDANHPLAGRDVIYEVRIVKCLRTDKEKIEGLASDYGAATTAVKVDNKSVELTYDGKVKKDADYFINKTSLVAAVFSYMKNFEKVEVKEEYSRTEIEKQEEEHDHGDDRV